MEFPKITAELPRLPGRGFFAVRHTAPGTQAPLGIVDALLAPGDRDHILSGVFNQFLSALTEPVE